MAVLRDSVLAHLREVAVTRADSPEARLAEGPPTDAALPALSRIAGRFSIEQRLGLGGMGSVYLAFDHEAGQRVALKIVHAGHPSLDARFEREARTLEGLEHPGIVRHLAHGITQEGTWFLATEVLSGRTLRDRFRSGVLDVGEALSIALPLADVLAFIHARGLVHRDLTPSNVFLCDDGSVRLIDFGLSGLAGGSHTLTGPGGVVGTVGYISPEQGRGEDVDGRTDVFSLGCLLVAMLTGQPPFGGAVGELLAQLERDVDPTRTLPAAVPAVVRDAIRAMLTRDPAQRTATALLATRHLIDDLTAASREREARAAAPAGPTLAGAEDLYTLTLSSEGPVGPTLPFSQASDRELVDPLWSLDDRHARALQSKARRWSEAELMNELLSSARGASIATVTICGVLVLEVDEGEWLRVLVAALRGTIPDEPALSRAAGVCELDAQVRRAAVALSPRMRPEIEDMAARAGIERAAVDRVLVEQRAYARVTIFGSSALRARLLVEGFAHALPCYVPATVAGQLPLSLTFRAKLVAELRPGQTNTEPPLVALKTLALARMIQADAPK